ncbi:MAG: hypothetical protein M1826_004941 [Phylliscum demangeonii]|nr:MAG: hypothetical protein M1826_004941 [Phylliscum demangeonii]
MAGLLLLLPLLLLLLLLFERSFAGEEALLVLATDHLAPRRTSMSANASWADSGGGGGGGGGSGFDGSGGGFAGFGFGRGGGGDGGGGGSSVAEPGSGESVPQSPDSRGSRSSLFGLSFLRGLTESKATTRDGQPAKRRGPKPDSKPAMTRRQELNRQAQRTHRERKELYVKALEQEVQRLREHVHAVDRDKAALSAENEKLQELLRQHGVLMSVVGDRGPPPPSSSSSSNQPAAFGGDLALAGSGYGVGPLLSPTAAAPPPGAASAVVLGGSAAPVLDYDVLGVDFVLTLEKPCMAHMRPALVRSLTEDGDLFGHALMATVPTLSAIDVQCDYLADLRLDPHHHSYRPPAPEPALPAGPDSAALAPPPPPPQPLLYAFELGRDSLQRLLELSSRFQLDGEVTPVMAWRMLLQHPSFPSLTAPDLAAIKALLAARVRCHGFGSVLEEFEVRDALDAAVGRQRRALRTGTGAALGFGA